MDIIQEIEAILGYGETCDHCLGRFYGKRSFGLTNEERGGRALRITRELTANEPHCEPDPDSCWICAGELSRTEEWAEKVVEALAGIEFETFLIGTKVPPIVAESEEMVWSDLSLHDPEPLKAEMNREVGKAVSAHGGEDGRPEKTRRRRDPRSRGGRHCRGAGEPRLLLRPLPEVRARHPPRPTGIAGRAGGAGCEKCDFTGKQYADSVEELIGRPAIEAFDAENAVLHGAGREDIDAGCSGRAAPFVMEIEAPRKRSVDLAALEAEINRAGEGRVAVHLDGWADRKMVQSLKSDKAHKKYRILVEIDGSVTPDEFRAALDQLKGVTIRQRTPPCGCHTDGQIKFGNGVSSISDARARKTADTGSKSSAKRASTSKNWYRETAAEPSPALPGSWGAPQVLSASMWCWSKLQTSMVSNHGTSQWTTQEDAV